MCNGRLGCKENMMSIKIMRMDDVAISEGPGEERRPTLDKRAVILLTIWHFTTSFLGLLLWAFEDPMLDSRLGFFFHI